MRAAFSRLQFLLEERSLTRADLHRHLAEMGYECNVKTIYRLADPDQALDRLDLNVAGAICEVLRINLGALVVFDAPHTPLLEHLSATAQKRLDDLMDRHNQGTLTADEVAELRDLVDQAETLTISNARRLHEHHRHLKAAPRTERQPASV